MTVIIDAATNTTEMTDSFFKDRMFRNELLADLRMGKVNYHELPIKLKYRRGIIMNSDIREVLEHAPITAYRNRYCVEGMCKNLLKTEKDFFSLSEYKTLIDNMRKANAKPPVWAKAILYIMKSEHSEAVLGYLFNGKMYI